MAVPTGTASMLDIQNEFGGTAPISLSEYYGVAAGIPVSGTISINDFRGKSNAIDPVFVGNLSVDPNSQGFVDSAGSASSVSGTWKWGGTTPAKFDTTAFSSVTGNLSCTAGVNYTFRNSLRKDFDNSTGSIGTALGIIRNSANDTSLTNIAPHGGASYTTRTATFNAPSNGLCRVSVYGSSQTGGADLVFQWQNPFDIRVTA